jgi:hypothetical protein
VGAGGSFEHAASSAEATTITRVRTSASPSGVHVKSIAPRPEVKHHG